MRQLPHQTRRPATPAPFSNATLPLSPLQVVCGQLLHSLVRRPAVCAALLDTAAWGSLCDAVGRGDTGLLQLAEKVQRRLLQSLLLAAHGLPGDAGNWAGRLLESTAAQLRQAGASEASARAALQRADGLHLVVSLLERLRGAVRGTTPATQAALFQQASGMGGWAGCGVDCLDWGLVREGNCRHLIVACTLIAACVELPSPKSRPPPAARLQFTSAAPALATLFDACRTQPVAVTLILKLVSRPGWRLSCSYLAAACRMPRSSSPVTSVNQKWLILCRPARFSAQVGDVAELHAAYLLPQS